MNTRACAAGLAIVFLATGSGCGVGEAKVTDEPRTEAAAPLPVEVVAPRVADIYATYETTAKIQSDSEAPVIARVEGQVVEIRVEEGDRVKAGQVLARLDGERLRLQMLQAKADLDKAAGEYERLLGLHERGLVSAASFDGLKFDREALQATYELKRLDYEYTTIRAPIDGVVSARDIKVGTHINANDTAFRITDTTKLVAHLKIPQTELDKFSVGNVATVRVDAMPEAQFEATIARISPTIDTRNGTFRATTYLNNEGGELAPGMFGRFSIAYEKHSGAILVPINALLTEDNEDVLYVVVDGAAVRRPVTVGIESLGMIEILRGLADGEQVIVTGQGGLRDGSKVLASNATTENITG